MKFAIRLLAPIFVLALAVPAAYASHHGGDHGDKAAAETAKEDKDCSYSKTDSACGTGKCDKCAKCDAGACDGENCEENGCGDCGAEKAGCDKCEGAEGKDADCCEDGGECEKAKQAEGGCPHCGKNN